MQIMSLRRPESIITAGTLHQMLFFIFQMELISKSVITYLGIWYFVEFVIFIASVNSLAFHLL